MAGVIDKEVNRVLKVILSEMEELAVLPSEVASSPYAFESRRRKVVRAVWDLVKEALKAKDSHGTQRA